MFHLVTNELAGSFAVASSIDCLLSTWQSFTQQSPFLYRSIPTLELGFTVLQVKPPF